MASKNKEESLRREGMAYALKIAKEKGVDGLEEECRFRGATQIPLSVSRTACDEVINRIKMNTIDTITILAAVTLHDEFGFGKKRINRFTKRFNIKTECLTDGYETWEGNIGILKDECGLEFGIRKNDTDVIVKRS